MTIFMATRKCIITMLMWCVLVVPAFAFEVDSNDAFVVRDVPVRADVTGDVIATPAARQSAVEVGAGYAFMQLAIDVLTSDDFSRLPLLNYADIQSAIRGYQVSNERVAYGKYHANISYAFYKQEVEALLEQHDIVLAEHHKEPILVIPLLQWDDEFLLWQGENPWQDAWNRVADDNKAWFINVPLGDVDDLSAIHISDVLSKDFTVLKSLQERYDSRYLVIAEARMDGDELRIDMEVLGESGNTQYSANYMLNENTDISQLMYRTSVDAGRFLYQYRRTRSEGPQWFETLASISATDPKTRVQLLGYFDSLRLISEVSIQEVSGTDIVVKLRHADARPTLKAYLENEGLKVIEQGDTWQVSKDYEQSKSSKNHDSSGAFLERHLPNNDTVSRRR